MTRKWELPALICGPVLCGLFGLALGAGDAGSEIMLALAFLVYAVLAEVPSIVAYRRALRNRYQVYLIDLLLAWSVIGWIVALVMSAGTGKGQHANPV